MTRPDLGEISCLLFVPGHRPDRFDKARAACPDGIVIDLEDAVPASEKDTARRAAACYMAEASVGPPVILRLNALGTRAALDDFAALADGVLAPDGLLLAKVESPREIELARTYDPVGRPLLAAIETAAGIEAAPAIARNLHRGDALGFGGADLAADLGAVFAWEPLYAARCALVRAAAAARIAVFDVPYLDIGDSAGIAAESRRVRALGFTGKLAIHPAQIEPIRSAFLPTPEEVEQAGRIVAALEEAHGGAAQLDGKMIDVPVVITARRILARAAATGPSVQLEGSR
jgi:(S)-citramalyl-CoA lyase